MVICKKSLLVVLATWLVMGCTAITDFEEPAEKVDIAAEVNQALVVTLDNTWGTLDLVFRSALPVDHADEVYDMIGNEITLLVFRTDTGVGFPLTTEPVTGAPIAPGQYAVVVSDDNKTVSIRFFNESPTGEMFVPGVGYNAVLSIAENDYFETATIPFVVIVR